MPRCFPLSSSRGPSVRSRRHRTKMLKLRISKPGWKSSGPGLLSTQVTSQRPRSLEEMARQLGQDQTKACPLSLPVTRPTELISLHLPSTLTHLDARRLCGICQLNMSITIAPLTLLRDERDPDRHLSTRSLDLSTCHPPARSCSKKAMKTCLALLNRLPKRVAAKRCQPMSSRACALFQARWPR